MSLIFSKKSFQRPICQRMLYPDQNWLYTIFFEVLLEIAIPIAILMHAMSSKRTAMIEYEPSHRAKLPVSFYHLINDLFTVLGIDHASTIVEAAEDEVISISNSLPVRIIHEASSKMTQTLMRVPSHSCQSIWPADRLCFRLSNPFASILLVWIILSQAECFQIHVDTIMRDASFIDLSYRYLKHPCPKSLTSIGQNDNLSFF